MVIQYTSDNDSHILTIPRNIFSTEKFKEFIYSKNKFVNVSFYDDDNLIQFIKTKYNEMIITTINSIAVTTNALNIESIELIKFMCIYESFLCREELISYKNIDGDILCITRVGDITTKYPLSKGEHSKVVGNMIMSHVYTFDDIFFKKITSLGGVDVVIETKITAPNVNSVNCMKVSYVYSDPSDTSSLKLHLFVGGMNTDIYFTDIPYNEYKSKFTKLLDGKKVQITTCFSNGNVSMEQNIKDSKPVIEIDVEKCGAGGDGNIHVTLSDNLRDEFLKLLKLEISKF